MTEQPPGNYPPPPPGGYPPPPPPQGGGYPGQGFGGPGYQPQGVPPNNNLVWAILSTVLCCLPLGIVAIVKSTQVSGLWAQGRYDEANKAAADAKKYAIWGAIAGVVVAVIYIIIAIVGGVASMDMSS
ncbi:CD225/dispanin family protein [Mycolicibacterium sp. S2-37]|uniref:CD225/dispanin family protein n=1 Tax=Mycolicibacterium sp. S2-37 TaxID=2810297 RepID=UPI001A93B293|nr:CD225/dispanin family protein [Mycolicibacterium sp. S2-37]MBO0679457.1 CD225/dispanin family protein [Mycolicibacterium sp. S2-37]